MNLLTDKFISTTEGKVSLSDILTSDVDYALQYAFDETQLAMLQLLGSLSTVVLKPTKSELTGYLEDGVTEVQYQQALQNVELALFDDEKFMRSSSHDEREFFKAPVTKLVSGIECGGSANAFGLFSEVSSAEVICPDCAPVLNYNLHMNIKGECFSSTGATGIRGGGAITTLIAGRNLKQTVLANTMTTDFFSQRYERPSSADNRLMWEAPPEGEFYYAKNIGLERGLFATAYHIDFSLLDESCICDVCGEKSSQSIKEFSRLKYTGSYGSTKTGRDSGAGWWPHPYTPTTKKDDGIYPVCARGESWQSWQNLTAYVIGRETDKGLSIPAPIILQYQALDFGHANLLLGGNIANQGSVIGRVYDLYSMPERWDKRIEQISKVVDAGIAVKDRLSQAFKPAISTDSGCDKKLVFSVKDVAMREYISNAQVVVQNLMLDVDRKRSGVLREEALAVLKNEAVSIFKALTRKYQNNLPLFKALVKGEKVLLSLNKVKN